MGMQHDSLVSQRKEVTQEEELTFPLHMIYRPICNLKTRRLCNQSYLVVFLSLFMVHFMLLQNSYVCRLHNMLDSFLPELLCILASFL